MWGWDGEVGECVSGGVEVGECECEIIGVCVSEWGGKVGECKLM